MNKKKVLWVTPKFTLPALDGARIASEKLLKFFPHDTYELHYLCLSEDDDESSRKAIQSIFNAKSTHFIQRPKKTIWMMLKSLMTSPCIPLTFASFNHMRVRRKVATFVDSTDFQTIVFDGLHPALSFMTLDLKSKAQLVYRAHNIESDLWFEKSEKTKFVLTKFFYLLQARLVKKIESEVLETVHGIAPIYKEDQAGFVKMCVDDKFNLTPLGLEFDIIPTIEDTSSVRLLYIGRLDWPPNRDGLKWFLKQVWPEVVRKRKDLYLDIVGIGNSNWLRPFLESKNLKFHGVVGDVAPFYKNCDYTIVPIFYGSGTRIKFLEPYCYGRLPIATSMAAQGSGVDEGQFLCVNSQKEWINILELCGKLQIECRNSRSLPQ